MTDPDSQGEAIRSERQFFGTLLMAIGGLIASLCGLCTLGWVGLTLAMTVRMWSRTGLTDLASSLAVTFVVGVVPTGFGVMLFAAGRSLRRPSRPRTDTPPPLP